MFAVTQFVLGCMAGDPELSSEPSDLGTVTQGATSTTIVVRAKGSSGSESVTLKIGGTTVATWTLTTAMVETTYTSSLTGNVTFHFNNDASGRDVQCDYIKVNGVTRQAEAQSTNTGAWNSAQSTCGGVSSEWLHCGGYIDFGSVSSSSTPSKWVGTWGASPYLTESSNMPPVALSNNTIRQVVRVSIGGSKIRLKFSNQWGNAPLVMQSVHLAVSTGGSAINSGTDSIVTFNGSQSVTVAAGSTVTSDTLAYNLPALTNMAITTYFGSVPSALTGHPGSRTTSYIKTGNAVSVQQMSSSSTTDHWYVITGIDIGTDDTAYKSAIGFGDSITDGRGTTTNAQNRWTDLFATRLRANTATSKVGVLNQGIGGTLVSSSGLSRFDRDVLGQSGTRYVVILYGINDIVYGGASATTVTNAYKTLISKAHARGLLVYGGTILPFGSSSSYTASLESIRQTVNTWIKSTTAANGGFDRVIDFDTALRDPNNKTKLLSTYDSGDGLHPGPAGYQKMADTINLSYFTN
jgi:lysophospholipase L1-like esterase